MMSLQNQIKLLEMDHAYWLAHANRYGRDENYVHLFDDATGRCHNIRNEIENLYKQMEVKDGTGDDK